jgi:hypothetical protein
MMQMEKWMSPELQRLLALLGVGFIGLTAVTGFLIAKIRGSFKPYSRATILYLLAYGAAFALLGFGIGLGWFTSYLQYYIFFQLIATGLGSLHLYTMNRLLKWTSSNTFWPELLLTLVITLLGALCFVMTYRVLNREGLEVSMASAVLFFIPPFFVYRAFTAAIAIPPKILRQWFYPIHQHGLLEPDETKLKNLLVISFEFQKNKGDKYFTNFRAKAPVDMEFGELFYYFINDYNERHPNSVINYKTNTGEPDGWIFYKKPKWYTIFTSYIDAERTVFINHIRENDVIICNRIL